ncbi:MAG: PLP-dependent aminotransferase family protein, partial [Anaerolineales bacterium]|nr:PLP-dependent aminotransferase family protein [Anaerolineales bacterium]
MSEIQSGGPPDSISFIYGHVDQSLFPIQKLQQASQITCSENAFTALNYGGSAGYTPLRDYIRQKIFRDENLDIASSELMITYGSSGGLDIVMRMFTRPGDTILAGAPSYHEALAVICDYPVKLVSIPLDNEGLVVDIMAEKLKELVRAGEKPSLVYTIPSFQNPSGITLSEQRRVKLLELANRYDLIVIEDDVYRDLYFNVPPPASMFSYDRNRVLRLGSFSKILAPGLRLGWLMGPGNMLNRIKNAGVIQSGGGINPFTANMVANFCASGWME